MKIWTIKKNERLLDENTTYVFKPIEDESMAKTSTI
jgi:hypothetical protein